MIEDLEDEKLTVEKIAALDSVKRISPVRLHSIDELVSTASVDSIPSGGGVKVRIAAYMPLFSLECHAYIPCRTLVRRSAENCREGRPMHCCSRK